jgi:hypothetical protein
MAEYDPTNPDGQYQYEDQGPPLEEYTPYDAAGDAAAARRAIEDQEVDEYGLHRPATSWTERLTDYAYSPEEAQCEDRPWYADGNAFLAAPAALAGHFMDELSPVDTQGNWHVPVPILGEMAHANHEAEYEAQRAAAEAAAQQQARDNLAPEPGEEYLY